MPEEEIHETTSLEAKRKHWHVVDKLPGDRVAVVRRDWALFKQIAGLQHKPDFAMEVFMQAFVTRVEELTTATYPDLLDSYERTGGVVIVPWKGEPLLEEDPRIGAGFTAPCVIGPRDWGSNELDTCEGVSADQGRRIIRHLATMHTLRMRVLPDPKLEGKLEMARHGVGLPDWWSTASTIMDHGFLRGITKHSTDTDTQFRIMLDPELPFRREIVRILGDVGVSVDLDAYEQRRNAALLAAAAKERRGTSAAAAAAAVSAAEEEAVLAVVDQGAEEVGEQELLSGAVRLEDVVGWPRDLIRARRIEYLLDLALSAANVTAPASGVKRKAGEDASNDTAAKRVKTASPTSPAALLESAAAELASRYQSTVGQDRVHRAVEAVTHARNLVAQLEGNTSDMDVQE